MINITSLSHSSRASLAACALGLLAGSASAYTVGPASIWDSTLAPIPPGGVYPILGTGQINGEFALETGIGVRRPSQIGLRAQNRFTGPVTPSLEGGPYVYDVPAGESAPGLALWNFDFHIDTGNSDSPGEPTNHGFPLPYHFLLQIDIDPDPMVTDFVDYTETDFRGLYGADPSRLSLYQESWNMGFGLPFDPNAEGVYDFRLQFDNGGLSQPIMTQMKVRVTGEAVPDSGTTFLSLAMALGSMGFLRRHLSGRKNS